MEIELVMTLIRDVKTSMQILTVALQEENMILAIKALSDAENELTLIRKTFEEPLNLDAA